MLKAKRFATGVFFVVFALTQFLIALPAHYGLAAYLWPATRLSETLGIRHRWAVFTHAHGDVDHLWYHMVHKVRVTDAGGNSREWAYPQTSVSLFHRYLHHRETDFVKSFNSTKQLYGTAFIRTHARKMLAENPSAKFPLKTEVFLEYTRIRPLRRFEPPGSTGTTLIYTEMITEEDRVCSKRDRL